MFFFETRKNSSYFQINFFNLHNLQCKVTVPVYSIDPIAMPEKNVFLNSCFWFSNKFSSLSWSHMYFTYLSISSIASFGKKEIFTKIPLLFSFNLIAGFFFKMRKMSNCCVLVIFSIASFNEIKYSVVNILWLYFMNAILYVFYKYVNLKETKVSFGTFLLSQ